MTEQTTQRPSPEGSVLAHELNHRVNNEVAAAIGVVGRIGLSSRFLLLSEAMIAAHAKASSARRQVQHP